MFKCTDCKKRFTTNFGFKKRRFDENTICGDWFRADEVWIKINGKQNYLFASMDDNTNTGLIESC